MKTIQMTVRGLLLSGLMALCGMGVRAQAPANDAFAIGVTLPASGPVRVTGTTVGATMETEEDALVMDYGDLEYSRIDSTVWYRWTPQVTGWCRCHTGGSESDTVLRISTGANLGSQVRIGWNDDAYFEEALAVGDGASGLVFWAERNVTYHMAVGVRPFFEPGPFVLHLDNGPSAVPAAIPTALGISPSTVDVTAAARAVSVTLTVSTGGVAAKGSAEIYFLSATDGNYFTPEVTGDLEWDTSLPAGGTGNASLLIPRYLEPEAWQAQVVLRGPFGELWFGSADSGESFVLPAGAARSLDVVNAGVVDREAPEISEEAVSRTAVDVRSRSEAVEISARVVDALAGVSGVDVIVSPMATGSTMDKVSGTIFDGKWSGTLTIPRHWPSGVYVLGILVYDRLGRGDYVEVSRLTVTGGGGYYEWAVGLGKDADEPFAFDPRVAEPAGDAVGSGVPNLLCYAFDLDPFAVGDGPGFLPETTLVGTGSGRRLSIRFLRRKDSAPELRYLPEFSSGAGGGWVAASGNPVVTDLGDGWESVRIDDTVTVGSSARRMGRVRVVYTD